jgi:Mrp family chromosome partitioning ATPase
VVPPGPPPVGVGEFFSNDGLDEVLGQLGDIADVVLVDTAPLLSVVDARALAGKVDALLVLIRPDVLRRPMLDELAHVLDSCPATKLGYVVVGEESGWEEEAYRYYLVGRAGERTSAMRQSTR